MKICPQCQRQFENNIAFCAFDGQQLVISSKEDALVGRLIDYKYQLHERIARGGTGSVYRGTHLQLNMPIAIKILHAETAQDFTSVERCRREAYAAMQIRHPNAIAVMDFGVTPDGLVYVVMEFLVGKTLRQKIKENRYPSLVEVNETIQQICAALSVAHRHKIIHRDLKPENIFVHKDGELEIVKVLDFGIAKFKDISSEDAMQLTRQGIVIGTPYYMSPEQCYGKEVDARSDIYSLGIMLYELLAGRLPFLGQSHTAIAVKQARETPRPIYEIRSNIPPVLNAVVMHALEKSPSNRPATIEIFAQELAAAMKAISEKEFMKVFLEASEQDLEAAILLTSDPSKIPSQMQVTNTKNKSGSSKKITFGYSNKAQADLLAPLSTINTLSQDLISQNNASITNNLESINLSVSDKSLVEDKSLSDTTSIPLTETVMQNYRDNFANVSREMYMLLQIILGDLETNQAVDGIFLNELKTTVDQLRSTIYHLQKITK
ncbi:MAG: serine/threonine protein kinase [Blastocatellia bacterium]|nr:serine/threonine protein kinase [Blastocatellia bacterium]